MSVAAEVLESAGGGSLSVPDLPGPRDAVGDVVHGGAVLALRVRRAWQALNPWTIDWSTVAKCQASAHQATRGRKE